MNCSSSISKVAEAGAAGSAATAANGDAETGAEARMRVKATAAMQLQKIVKMGVISFKGGHSHTFGAFRKPIILLKK